MSLFLKILVEGFKNFISNLLPNVIEGEKVHKCAGTNIFGYDANRILKY